jgi:phosphatidylserine/phosphatidylglycerophosphate/cardiolipin synthase-like enzyme
VDWILLATGATGTYTLLFLMRLLAQRLRPLPSHEVFFSPKGGCTEAVVAEIKHARHEVLVLAYSVTSQDIAKALVEAKLRGIHVEVVLDHSNETEQHTDLHFFLQEGLKPLIDPHHAIAHNKVMVIDSRTVVTGSFNFTEHAEHSNAENLLVLRNYTDLARAYRQNFLAHKEHARDPEVKAAPAAAPAHRAAA